MKRCYGCFEELSDQPYVIKLLLLGNVDRIMEEIICQAGRK